MFQIFVISLNCFHFPVIINEGVGPGEINNFEQTLSTDTDTERKILFYSFGNIQLSRSTSLTNILFDCLGDWKLLLNYPFGGNNEEKNNQRKPCNELSLW